jgi:hypothetical protein
MPLFELQDPATGKTYEVEAPDVDTAVGAFKRFTPQNEPRREQSYAAGLARSALGQGTFFGLGDEAMAGLRSIGGESYDTALEDERKKLAQFRDENPKTAIAGELAGGFATPGLGLLTGMIKPAATALGRIWQGSKLGAGFGGAYGFASSEGGEGNVLDQAVERGKGALRGAGAGAVVGGAVPVVGTVAGGAVQRVRDAISPTMARMTKGVEEAADEVMANRFRRSGTTPQQVADDLAAGREAADLPGSAAVLPEAIADVSPSMQRLGGSVYRTGNEAGEIAQEFVASRQGGDPAKGLFGRSTSRDVPMNQFERLNDTFKRAFKVKSKDFEKQKAVIRNEQKALGNESYKKAFAGQEDFGEDLSNTLTAWALRARDEPGRAEQSALQQALGTFYRADKSLTSDKLGLRLDDMEARIAKLVEKGDDASMAAAERLQKQSDIVRRQLDESRVQVGKQAYPIDNLERLDRAKRSLDGQISEAKNDNVKRLLVQMKNDILDAVHGGDRNNPTRNKLYKDARDEWGSRAELLEAADMGRKFLRGDGGVSAEDFRAMTRAEQNMFRLGVTKELRSMMGGKALGPTADFTQILRKPNVYERLAEVMPQGQTSAKMNEIVRRETRMSDTAREVLGNSKTAQRLTDDAELNGRDILSQAIDKYRSTPTLLNLGIDAIRAGAEKVFGFRDDMAVALARRLFTADPAEQAKILSAIEARMGKEKTSKFLEAMSRAALVATTSGAGQVGQGMAISAP